jgi:hypothetical protein
MDSNHTNGTQAVAAPVTKAKPAKSAKSTTAPAKAKKVAAAPKVQPVFKTLTVKFNKAENTYEVYDEAGKLYAEPDAPRQIMMFLAYKAGQVIYFRGKKWRRKSLTPKAKVTTTKVPAPAVTVDAPKA